MLTHCKVFFTALILGNYNSKNIFNKIKYNIKDKIMDVKEDIIKDNFVYMLMDNFKHNFRITTLTTSRIISRTTFKTSLIYIVITHVFLCSHTILSAFFLYALFDLLVPQIRILLHQAQLPIFSVHL